jgi:hypothetical protein
MVLKYSLPMGQPKIFIAKHEFLGKKKKKRKKKYSDNNPSKTGQHTFPVMDP